MRRIAIVGGGQAGFPLAFGLLQQGFEVTMVTRRAADEIAGGRVMSSQCMFDAALRIERDLGLNLWDGQCPKVEGIGLTVPAMIDWRARLDAPAQSVDQRVKMPAFMALFEQRGGTLLIEDVGLAQLERLAQEYELVIVAAGKDEVVRLFERDAARSPFDRPMRSLAMTYVTGMAPRPDYDRVAFNLVPGIGEYFTIPALSIGGPCEIMLLEGIPGGPFDRFQDDCSPQQHLAQTRALLDQYLPSESHRARHAELTDANGTLAGRLSPTVRKPVATLPSGKLVFGLGDALCVNDPITGQGSNNATKAAKVYLDAIVEHGELAYTQAWMEQTFARFWEYGQHVANWTNSLLTPPPPHILALLAEAGDRPPLASAIANGFDHPPGLFPWWADETQHYSNTEGA
jgi:hypothetical protein